MLNLSQVSWKLVSVATWLVLTLAMAGWWMYYSLTLLEQTAGSGAETLRQKNMLQWEGAAWMVLLLGGGLTLGYFVLKERRHSQRFRSFVAAFTHDLKTSLASMRLQAESLQQDLQGQDNSHLVDRLVGDTLRLQLQLENSLYLSGEKELQLFFEEVRLLPLVESLRGQWPQLKIQMQGDAVVHADTKALTSVLNNIVQNSLVHGRAKSIQVEVRKGEDQQVEVQLRDDGQGFSGETSQLGRLFVRHNPSSGTGVGLYIVCEMLRQMKGQVRFDSAQGQGFVTSFTLKGRSA